MQGEIIKKKILDDAKIKSQEIVLVAQQQADFNLDKTKEYLLEQRERTLNKADERKKEIQENYQILSRLEGKKIFLEKKQQILNSLQVETLKGLLSKTKKEKLKIVDNLVKKYADKNDNMLALVDGLTLLDFQKLPSVKANSLKVKLGTEQGIILSNKSCDKDLLFKTIISVAFMKKQKEIAEILFD